MYPTTVPVQVSSPLPQKDGNHQVSARGGAADLIDVKSEIRTIGDVEGLESDGVACVFTGKDGGAVTGCEDGSFRTACASVHVNDEISADRAGVDAQVNLLKS